MEYIRGRPLSAVWSTLSWFGRLRVALTMRSYIRQMRQIRHPRSVVPGPLAPEGEGTKRFESQSRSLPVEQRGSFNTCDDLISFLNDRMSRSVKNRGIEASSLANLGILNIDDSLPFVFTHSHLDAHHFNVGDDGHLWLVDFGLAGFFPEWWEFVAMRIREGLSKIRIRLGTLSSNGSAGGIMTTKSGTKTWLASCTLSKH